MSSLATWGSWLCTKERFHPLHTGLYAWRIHARQNWPMQASTPDHHHEHKLLSFFSRITLVQALDIYQPVDLADKLAAAALDVGLPLGLIVVAAAVCFRAGSGVEVRGKRRAQGSGSVRA